MLQKNPHSLVDSYGVVFFSQNNIYRAIFNDHEKDAIELLDSGLIKELSNEGLFPATSKSDVKIVGHNLVLEHEKINPVTYPYEWSPEMLRRAGLCVLRVNSIANKYGYELKDAHPYNVVFKNLHPIYVDFGSFSKRKDERGWLAYGEFLGSYYYPLIIYKNGLHSTFKHIFLISGVSLPISEQLIINHSWLGIFGKNNVERFYKYWLAYRNPSLVTEEKINRKFKSEVKKIIIKLSRKNRLLPFRKVNMDVLEKKIKRLKLSIKTDWGDYHSRSGYYTADGSIQLSNRMNRVLEIIKELSPFSVIDLACNQGILSREIAKQTNISKVICADRDASAIDTLVKSLDSSSKISPAVFDVMGEAWQRESTARLNRLKSDLVIALALTHHLILSQQYNIDRILNVFAAFTNKHVLLEFMPLGLFDGERSQPIPHWYNKHWFEKSLKKRFIILKEEELEANRILYLLKLKEK